MSYLGLTSSAAFNDIGLTGFANSEARRSMAGGEAV